MHPELHAGAPWRVLEFISDLHLAQDTPRGVAALEHYFGSTAADAVFILGDLFEAWVGDDARSAGFEQHCAALLAQAARRRWVGFMAGNRDFLVGEDLLRECGVHRLQDPTVLVAFDQRWLLSHGDALCIADVEYQKFRLQVRDAAWQAAFLAQPLARRRALAADMRRASQQRALGMPQGELWADVDAATALGWLDEAGAGTLIHGHTHRPGRVALDGTRVREVLSDWELDHGPGRAQVLRLTAGGLQRVPLAP